MKILVAGGSGFVGRHLVDRLLADGHAPTVMTRHPEERDDGAVDVFGDVGDPASMAEAFDGADVAYYLVHALDQADFADRDRDAARAFGKQAAASGVGRIVYLGGLGDDRDDLSPHLRSRREVEKILTAEAPTTALRAGIVVGDGGVSWEILCQLVERLPVMITPRWVQTTTQPIALPDIVAFLAAMADPALDVEGQHFDVGTPSSMTYKKMLEDVAHLLDRRLFILPVPILTPALSSHWLRLTTDVDLQTARSLVDSMTNEVVVTERRIEALTGHSPMTFVEAARLALADRAARTASGDGEAVPSSV